MIAGATAVEMADTAATNAKKIAATRCELRLACEFEHLSFLSKLPARVLPSLEAMPPQVSESLSDLMVEVYVKERFAKMTALPDNLTETPHSYAGTGHSWTFSTKS